MDRREFFRRAGVGAGALIAAPQLDLYNTLFPPEEEKPKVKVEYEAGFIYYGYEAVFAVNNVSFHFSAESIDVTTQEDWPVKHYIPGPMQATMEGDGLPLTQSDPFDYFGTGENLHICLNLPSSDGTIEADGIITGLSSSFTYSEGTLTYTFRFQVIGATTINENEMSEA